MKNRVLYLSFLILTIGFTSCNEILDEIPKDKLNEAIVWNNVTAAEQFVNGIYTSIPSGFERNEPGEGCGLSLLETTTDDGNDYVDWVLMTALTTGNYSPSYYPMNSQYGSYYSSVRKANIALERLPSVAGNAADLKRLRGEAFFLRAYIYHELLRFYGYKSKETGTAATGVVLIDKSLSPTDNFLIPRASYDATVNFIVKDLDSAAVLLPNQSGTVYGRATIGAALALKSRVLLYAERWSEAAEAAKKVSILAPEYTLYKSYRGVFVDKNNSEVIFAKKYAAPNIVHGNGIDWSPGYEGVNAPASQGGWGGLAPTQNLVDSYEMTDGNPTSASPLYNVSTPYANLDPRFEQTILHNGSTNKSAGKTYTIQTYVGGADYVKNQTGYYLRKFHDESKNTSGPSVQDWIFIRYAEVLLNYAEAQNEASGPDATVYEAINKIRSRADIKQPPIQPGLSQAQMREKIRNERRIELAFEEHRFFDVRRWGIAKDVLNGNIFGIRITKDGDNLKYEKYPIAKRTYNDKMKVLPLPAGEVQKNTAAPQIAGW